MKLMNSLKKLAVLRFSIGMIIVGLIIAIVSGIIFFKPDNGDYKKVNATLLSIESHGTGEDIEYEVYVKYTVDGKEYESIFNGYDSRWKVGDTIEVEYNVEDPTVLSGTGSKTMALIICIIGIGACGYGAFSLKKGLKSSSKDFAQYDRVENIDEAKANEIKNRNEPKEEFVFHFTGHLN